MGSCGTCFNCGKILIEDYFTGNYPNEILLCNDCMEKMSKFYEAMGNHPIEFCESVKGTLNSKENKLMVLKLRKEK